ADGIRRNSPTGYRAPGQRHVHRRRLTRQTKAPCGGRTPHGARCASLPLTAIALGVKRHEAKANLRTDVILNQVVAGSSPAATANLLSELWQERQNLGSRYTEV